MDTAAEVRRARLAQLIKENYESQADFIRKTGINQGEVSALLKNKSFGEKKARSIEESCGLPTGWLSRMDDNNPPALVPALKKKDTIQINQYETGGSMGVGIVLRDQPGVIQSWSVSTEWLEKNVRHHSGAENLAVVTGFGDSMKGMFNPGDPLLIDTGVIRVEYDGAYFFRVGDEGFIKRLQRIPGVGMVAISENKAYREWTITQDMDFHLFGRVLKVWESTDF